MPDRTIRLHRVLRAKPERVSKAFTDPRALVKWLPPHGFVAEMLEVSGFKVGGGYRMAFINLGTGQSHSFRVKFLELTPTRIRHTDTFDDPSMPGEMTVTVTFTPVLCGTELHITQENIPPQIPLEFCVLGWQESLTLLTQLVEPEIP